MRLLLNHGTTNLPLIARPESGRGLSRSFWHNRTKNCCAQVIDCFHNWTSEWFWTTVDHFNHGSQIIIWVWPPGNRSRCFDVEVGMIWRRVYTLLSLPPCTAGVRRTTSVVKLNIPRKQDYLFLINYRNHVICI